MTLTREMQPVELISYTTDTDDYGQKRQVVQSTIRIPMMIKEYSITTNNTPIYEDVEAIGLTTYNSLLAGQTIKSGATEYYIVRVIHNGRLTEAFLKVSK